MTRFDGISRSGTATNLRCRLFSLRDDCYQAVANPTERAAESGMCPANGPERLDKNRRRSAIRTVTDLSLELESPLIIRGPATISYIWRCVVDTGQSSFLAYETLYQYQARYG